MQVENVWRVKNKTMFLSKILWRPLRCVLARLKTKVLEAQFFEILLL